MNLIKWLTGHLKSADESYFLHFRCASYIGVTLLLAGAAAIIHAIFPFLLTRTASNLVTKINAYLTDRRNSAS